MSQPPEDPSDPCLICPNRRADGLILFGRKIGPTEIMLQLGLLVLLGMPAAKASVLPDYGVKEALAWFGAIVGGSTAIRLSPTERIDAYRSITGKGP